MGNAHLCAMIAQSLWIQPLLVAHLLVLYVQPVSGDCAQLGCSDGGTNNLVGFSPALPSSPRLLWSSTVGDHSVRRLLCTSAESILVCATDRGDAAATGVPGLIAVNGSNGKQLWERSGISDTMSYMVRSVDGGTIATDGATLVGYTGLGDPYGPPVSVYGNSTSFSLAVTDNDVVIICFRHSERIAAYLTNAVPHASLALEGVVDGQEGVYIPDSNPVVGLAQDGSHTRVYFTARFHTAGEPSATCALFGMDVYRTLDNRLDLAWNFTYSCDTKPVRDRPLLSVSNRIVMSHRTAGHEHALVLKDLGESISLVHNVTVASGVDELNSISLVDIKPHPSVLLSFTGAAASHLSEMSLETGNVTTAITLATSETIPLSRVMLFRAQDGSINAVFTVQATSIHLRSGATARIAGASRNANATWTDPWSLELGNMTNSHLLGMQIVDVGTNLVISIGEKLHAITV